MQYAPIISYCHLKYLHNSLLSDADFTRFYTCGPIKKTGRNAIMSAAERNILVACGALNSTTRIILQIMKRDFIALYHGDYDNVNHYSLSTFNREMHRPIFSVKNIESTIQIVLSQLILFSFTTK